MPEIIKRNKALSVSPLKASSTIGAALAFLGFRRAIPMLHGSQGCTAFGKVFFVRHFREPIPLQSTAMDQVSAIMGANENVVEGLKTLCEKNAPDLIGVPTTGLAETQGADIHMAVREFRAKLPAVRRHPGGGGLHPGLHRLPGVRLRRRDPGHHRGHWSRRPPRPAPSRADAAARSMCWPAPPSPPATWSTSRT